MGEEEKQPEEQKVEEAKKPEEEKKEEPKPDQKPSAEKKEEEKKAEESKDNSPPPPPTPPQEIILRVYMHCEGCARKVRRCLKGFEGVEDVQTDCKTHKVVVKGEKADPLKVLERVQRKSHRQVELLSPIPKPPAEEPKKEEKEIAKPEEKKEPPPQVITAVLKVHMHCEACAQEIKKRIQRMKGVESADPDFKGSQVTVKGVFEPPKLVEYVYKRSGKHAVVVKQEPEIEKKEEDKVKEGKEEKKAKEAGDKDEKKVDVAAVAEATADGGEEKNEKKEGGGEEAATKPEGAEQEETKLELKKNEFYYYYPQQSYQIYPPTFATESYSYSYPPPAPPAHDQLFSDENPNACYVM